MTAWVRAAFPMADRAGPVAWAALLLLAAEIAVAALAPAYGYPVGADVDVARANLGPSAEAWLGTDHLGRSVLPRLALATRSFVGPAAAAVVLLTGIGVPLGVAAGWAPAAAGAPIRVATGTLAGIPKFVWIVLVLAPFGSGSLPLAAAIAAAHVPEFVEALRARVEALADAEFVVASRVHGVSSARLIGLHIVVGACGALIARQWLGLFGAVVVVESTLAYLGALGVQEPTPSWGNMIAFAWGRGASAAWIAPTIALWLTVGAVAAAGPLFREPPRG